MNKQEFQILQLLLALYAARALDQDVQQVEEVHEDGHVELFKLPLVVKLHGMKPLNALALQRADNEVITLELVAKHHVAVSDGWRRLGGQTFSNVLICVLFDVLHGWWGQGTNLLWFTHDGDLKEGSELVLNTSIMILVFILSHYTQWGVVTSSEEFCSVSGPLNLI